MNDFFSVLRDYPVTTIIIAFLGTYPMCSAIQQMVTAWWYRRGRRAAWVLPTVDRETEAMRRYPTLSVIIAAHNEERTIEDAISCVLNLDWPVVDLIVVDDGSSDDTVSIVRPYALRGQLRLLRKPVNEGKALAINDGLVLARGDLALVLDADGRPERKAARFMAAHFLMPRVAAVTGNPRVGNTRSIPAHLQAVEFSASVAVQRRGDEAWGRLTTVSGLCVMLRRPVMVALGGFDPLMVTEDIELTWRLQINGYEAVYEPAALFGMEVPQTWRQLWHQRRRWARGLAQVLRRHGWAALHPSHRRMWPNLILAWLSLIWVHAEAVAILFGLIGWAIWTPVGEWVAVLAFMAACTVVTGVAQVITGMMLDRKVDPKLFREVPWAAWYPAFYWMLMALCVLRDTIPGLVVKPRSPAVWHIARIDDPERDWDDRALGDDDESLADFLLAGSDQG
ncbi:MAG: glycosyltransferase [Propionibacteriaceae bacterium]|jgi:biofilm PGA synthesis N-glycosyltransferase PgaC|nr:glycosyltransferase [Propionibacteriaceae bacterium]